MVKKFYIIFIFALCNIISGKDVAFEIIINFLKGKKISLEKWVELIRYYASKGEYKKAMYIGKILKRKYKDKNLVEIYDRIKEKERIERSRVLFKEALRLKEKFPLKAAFFYVKAIFYNPELMKRNDYGLANLTKSLMPKLKSLPKNKYYLYLGLINEIQGNIKKALEYYNEALKTKMDHYARIFCNSRIKKLTDILYKEAGIEPEVEGNVIFERVFTIQKDTVVKVYESGIAITIRTEVKIPFLPSTYFTNVILFAGTGKTPFELEISIDGVSRGDIFAGKEWVWYEANLKYVIELMDFTVEKVSTPTGLQKAFSQVNIKVSVYEAG